MAAVDKRPSIVIVDDAPTIHRVLNAQLQRIFGGQVELISVGDGQNALQALTGMAFEALTPHFANRTPHQASPEIKAAFMDNQMPKVPDGPVVEDAGIAVTQAVRAAEGKSRHVCIFAYSADPDQGKFSSSGVFDRVLPKPSPLARIQGALREAGLFS